VRPFTGTATPSPVPEVPNPRDVSPGFGGFLTIFLLALATVLLIRSMVGRLRRLRYSQAPDGEQQDPDGEQRDGEQQAPGGS
jgi:hypothetical protein